MLNFDTSGGVTFDSITEEEIRAFVGPKAPYYLYQFSKFNSSGREIFKPTWNWSCFGFTFIWMLYRKMYIQAVVTFVIFCLPGINIIMHILAGCVGNYLYYRHVRGRILEIRATRSPGNIYPVLTEAGGVHRWAFLVAIAVGVILAILFVIFFATITATISRFGVISI
jgi:hypothetical protein